MADGSFPSLVSKDRDVNALGNPIYVQLSDGTAAINVTSNALDVNLTNASVTVTATDLDIRDLVYTQDSILIYANTAKDGSGTDYVPLVDTDGKLIISNPGGTEYTEDVAAPAAASGSANLAERIDTPAAITPAVGDWSKFYVNANGSQWVAIDGEVSINDGGNTITVDGTVAATQSGTWVLGANDGVDIGDVTVNNGAGAAAVNIQDGGNSITVDGTVAISGDVNVTATDLDIRDLSATQDNVAISDGTDTLAVNTDGSINVNIVSAAISGEVHDYDTASAVASDSTSNHDYTVTGTTFLLKSVIVSGSGNVKFEIQTGPLASLATVAVGFLTGRQGDTKQVFFDPPIEVPVASTGTVRIIRTNRQGSATDLYSTIIGQET